MWKILISTIVLVGVITGAVAGTANGAAPGDLLYGIDRGLESLQIGLTTNQAQKVQLELNAAQERVEEARLLVQRGDQAHLDQAMAGLDLALATVTQTAVQSTGAQAQAIGSLLDSAFNVQDGGAPQPDGSKEAEDGAYCNGAQAGNHPVGERLAQRYTGASYTEVMKWFCQGYGFGEIDLAYRISQQGDLTVDELFALKQQGLGWGEIMQTAGLIGNSHKPAKDGDQEISETEEPEETEEPGDRAFCSSTEFQPHAQQLSKELSVPYEDIMKHFCDGFGFGEIKLAYTISQTKDVDVNLLFQQKNDGKGWGEIMKEYGLVGKQDKDLKEKDKPDDKGKPDEGPNHPEDKPGGKPTDKPGNSPEGKTKGKSGK